MNMMKLTIRKIHALILIGLLSFSAAFPSLTLFHCLMEGKVRTTCCCQQEDVGGFAQKILKARCCNVYSIAEIDLVATERSEVRQQSFLDPDFLASITLPKIYKPNANFQIHCTTLHGLSLVNPPLFIQNCTLLI